MVTWNTIERTQQQSRDALVRFFDRLVGRPDSAQNVAKALIAHMRKENWSYTTNAQSLKTALSTKKINCDNLSDLLVFLYVYNNRPNNVTATRVDVHQANAPVFLPRMRVTRPGLNIDMNVQGQLQGWFFSSGHRVASLGGVCYDLITGNKGAVARMNTAYMLCTRVDDDRSVRYRFNYQGHERYLAMQAGSTAQGLRKFICPF